LGPDARGASGPDSCPRLVIGASRLSATLDRPMMPVMAPPEAPILVVDDDPKIVALVRTYLERERYPVITASDGKAALRAIESDQPGAAAAVSVGLLVLSFVVLAVADVLERRSRRHDA